MRINSYDDFFKLEILHTFDYYDFPLFFISQTADGWLNLHYYIEETDEGTDKWFFSRISNREKNRLLKQQVGVLELLNHIINRDRMYYMIVEKGNINPTSKINFERVTNENLDPEALPIEEFFVDYDYVRKVELSKDNAEVQDEPIDGSRFKIVLADYFNRHDISLDLLMSIMNNFKKTLIDIGNDIGNTITEQVRSTDINLRVDSFQPSSFGVWLSTEPTEINGLDMFEITEKSLRGLFNIIEDISSNNINHIEEQIELDEIYSLDTIRQLRNLLKEISDNNYTLKLQGNTKYSDYKKEVTFERNSIDKILSLNELLSKYSTRSVDKINVEGTLVSVNITRNSFRISTKEGPDIKGSMSTDLIKKLRKDTEVQFKVPSLIKATIQKETILDYVNDNYSEKYKMISFEQ